MKTIRHRKPKVGYKFITDGMRSANGGVKWEVGVWHVYPGELELCRSGFHACETPRQSLSYVLGDQWVKVEYTGEVKGDDKVVAKRMRVVAKIDTKVAAVKFAIWCARQSLPAYELKYPDDKRPRQAIEAAEKWLEDHTFNASAAWIAAESAAKSAARSAASAAWSAAWDAAKSAAWIAAESAARSAAWSAAWDAAKSAAWSAADAAESAAKSAARSAASAARSAARSAASAARSAADAAWSAASAARSAASAARSAASAAESAAWSAADAAWSAADAAESAAESAARSAASAARSAASAARSAQDKELERIVEECLIH